MVARRLLAVTGARASRGRFGRGADRDAPLHAVLEKGWSNSVEFAHWDVRGVALSVVSVSYDL